MHYAYIDYNDTINGEGVCVSFWAQGCPFHCKGCHNQSTWDFDGGKEDNENTLIWKVINGINANGIQRNLSILGGEPLVSQNRDFIAKLIYSVRNNYENIKIFLWTGFTIEELKKIAIYNHSIKYILENVDIIIDGQFEEENRDISLQWRGSPNQRILQHGKDF